MKKKTKKRTVKQRKEKSKKRKQATKERKKRKKDRKAKKERQKDVHLFIILLEVNFQESQMKRRKVKFSLKNVVLP